MVLFSISSFANVSIFFFFPERHPPHLSLQHIAESTAACTTGFHSVMIHLGCVYTWHRPCHTQSALILGVRTCGGREAWTNPESLPWPLTSQEDQAEISGADDAWLALGMEAHSWLSLCPTASLGAGEDAEGGAQQGLRHEVPECSSSSDGSMATSMPVRCPPSWARLRAPAWRDALHRGSLRSQQLQASRPQSVLQKSICPLTNLPNGLKFTNIGLAPTHQMCSRQTACKRFQEIADLANWDQSARGPWQTGCFQGWGQSCPILGSGGFGGLLAALN